MRLSFLPIRSDDVVKLVRAGDVLTINGEAFDFTALPEGASLPREAVNCEWLAGDVARTDGVICLSLLLPHGAGAPHHALFPQPVNVVGNGAIDLPGQATMEALQ